MPRPDVVSRQVDWTEMPGQEMISRAGSVTVRKMVETTKSLLQGLEGALVLRAGFMAGCFHLWRCSTTLSRAEHVYQEQFHRQHNEWEKHLELTRRHYESELQRLQSYLVAHKDKAMQQLTEAFQSRVFNDKEVLKGEVWLRWSQHALSQHMLRVNKNNVQVVIERWAESKSKLALHVAYNSWRNLAEHQRAARRREAELTQTSASQQATLEAALRVKETELEAKWKELERRHKDGASHIVAMLGRWEKGSRRALLLLTVKGWIKCTVMSSHREAIEMQMRKWAEGDRQGLKHSCYIAWKLEAQKAQSHKLAEQHNSERGRLEKMLVDAEKQHKGLLELHVSTEERRKREAEAVVHCIIRKWSAGSSRGLLKEVVALWGRYVKEVKRLGRERQAVHMALERALQGDRQALKHMTFKTWWDLTKSEKLIQEQERNQQDVEAKLGSLLSETQAQHDARMSQIEARAASLQERTQNAAQVAQKWLAGEARALLTSAFGHWRSSSDKEKRRQGVKAALLRSLEGESRGVLHMGFICWKNFMQMEVEARHRATDGQDGRAAQLQEQLDRIISQRETYRLKYLETFASKQAPALKHMVFAAWCAQRAGRKYELEKAREQQVALQDMESQRRMSEALHNERRARVLSAIGCKHTIVLCSAMFEAWVYLWEKIHRERAAKLDKNEAMLRYSEFVVSRKCQQDRATLLISSFAEWCRESKILRHQSSHDGARATIAKLEQQKAELEEQLTLYYHQIDNITGTLQKELKAKAELATELANAYRMRKTMATPTTATTVATAADQMWSRTSSEQTLVEPPTTPAIPSKVMVPRSAPLGQLVPPGMPQLPWNREARPSQEVEAALEQAYREAAQSAVCGGPGGLEGGEQLLRPRCTPRLKGSSALA